VTAEGGYWWGESAGEGNTKRRDVHQSNKRGARLVNGGEKREEGYQRLIKHKRNKTRLGCPFSNLHSLIMGD